MKVSITGCSGFIGQNIRAYFESRGTTIIPVSMRQGLNIELFDGSNAVVHLAGKAHDLGGAPPDLYYRINTDLTKVLFDFYLESDIKDFIYFSSVKAVVDSCQGALDEDEYPCPRSPYGRSKLAAEEYILGKKLPLGKRLFVLRPCMVHGPGNKGNLNLLFNLIKKGVPYPLAAFNNRRSFLSINNLAFILDSILRRGDILGGVYNVADDEPLSTIEVVNLIAEVLNKRPNLLQIPRSVIRATAKLGDFLHLSFNSERLTKLTENYVVSNEKIKRALGIKCLPLPSREGLLYTLGSFDL